MLFLSLIVIDYYGIFYPLPLDIKPTLYYWDKIYLVIAYSSFYMLLDLAC